MQGKQAQQRLRDVFARGFEVADLAEPLRSFDADRPAVNVRETAERLNLPVVGIRRDGELLDYAQLDELVGGTCGECSRPIPAAWRISAQASLMELFSEERGAEVVFVESLGSVVGIVTPDDLQKPALRMWVFGVITIVEMAFTRLIDERFPDGGWTGLITESRLNHALTLHEERHRRGRTASLLDCLQFGDKGSIICRDEQLRGRVGFQSKRRGEQAVRQVELLRNQLAHAQVFLEDDIQTILRLAVQLDRVLALAAGEPPENTAAD